MGETLHTVGTVFKDEAEALCSTRGWGLQSRDTPHPKEVSPGPALKGTAQAERPGREDQSLACGTQAVTPASQCRRKNQMKEELKAL